MVSYLGPEHFSCVYPLFESTFGFCQIWKKVLQGSKGTISKSLSLFYEQVGVGPVSLRCSYKVPIDISLGVAIETFY